MSNTTLTDRPLGVWSNLSGLELSQRYVTAGGIRTRIVEAGDPGLPNLLLLHGTGGHVEAFARNLAALATDFHVVAYDMVGHGVE